jgi:hypothetical protein
MDLPVELVQLLKHAGINGQKLTWDLQVNSNAVSVKLVWIKAGKPVDKTGETTSLAQKKRHLSPSTTSISSFCWIFARYIFHVLVVYHQYLYQVYTLESDR